MERRHRGFINVENLRKTFLSCLVRLGSCDTKYLSLFAMVVGSEHVKRSSNNFDGFGARSTVEFWGVRMAVERHSSTKSLLISV